MKLPANIERNLRNAKRRRRAKALKQRLLNDKQIAAAQRDFKAAQASIPPMPLVSPSPALGAAVGVATSGSASAPVPYAPKVLLRYNDPCAAETLRFHAAALASINAPERVLGEFMAIAHDIDLWQRAHGTVIPERA